MTPLAGDLEAYFKETLGDTPVLTPWKEERHLAPFLRERYRFFKAHLLGRSCLFLADRESHEETPATIRKHVEQVQARWEGPVIYVRRHITPCNRRRLVDQKVPFVVPGNQMYLPMVGLDFREHFRGSRPKPSVFRPSSQAVLIHALLRGDEDLSPTALAAKLGYSAMAMSLALDELEAAGIGESNATGRGRERRLRLTLPGPEVWKKAAPFLRTPVRNRSTIRQMPGRRIRGPLAGLSALAQCSLLAEPDLITIALDRKGWKALHHGDRFVEAMPDDPDGRMVEIWNYDPNLFAGDGRVDPLSLYLSLRDNPDERVQAALDQMMRKVPWR